jgi:hypothetical protein
VSLPAAVAAALVALVALVAATVWWSGGGEGARVILLPHPAPKAQPAGGLVNSASVARVVAATSAAAIVSLDPVGGAADLKRVFDEFIASGEPRERRIAQRAFAACVPAFLPAASETPSPEPLIRALPAGQRTQREAAYWGLFARCRGFLGDGRDALERTQQQLLRDLEAAEPGLRAREDLLAGNSARIDALVSQGLSAADPAAVAALSGSAIRLARQRDPDGADANLARRASAIDAALPLVACDLGLDCSATSLAALQLCAVQAACSGDLPSRWAQQDGIDLGAPEIRQERARLLALVRGGRALGTADLLP